MLRAPSASRVPGARSARGVRGALGILRPCPRDSRSRATGFAVRAEHRGGKLGRPPVLPDGLERDHVVQAETVGCVPERQPNMLQVHEHGLAARPELRGGELDRPPILLDGLEPDLAVQADLVGRVLERKPVLKSQPRA